MYMPQSYLDEFVEIKVEKREKVEERVEEGMERGEEVVEERVEVIGEVEEVGEEFKESRKSEKMNIIADLKDPEHRSRCPYCGEWVGRLHGGALHLYVKGDRLFALADMDHVYKNCKHGLIENIRFLYRMMAELWGRGYKVFAVGKAYDDDLYAWVYGGGRDVEYDGLKVAVFKAPETAEDFERFSYGLEMVSLSVVDEALKGMGVDGR
ncbi:hypothetical protein DRO47_02480 [Candidatus Bathyarchaeota archaeon]|nr:MAG: hypothetical protein DRO47_02480 [Candidatus Bathyarchaeota archaeon]